MSCIFPQCENTKYFCKNSNIRFFKVPTFPKTRQQWLEVCKICESDLPKEPMVCSKHFMESDVTLKAKRVRLDKDAVPINTSQLNEFIGNEQYVEEYLEEYIEECDDFLEGCNEIKREDISQKIVRKSYGLALSQQNDVLTTMSELVKNLFAPRKTGNLLPFQRGIIQNNNGLRPFLDHLKKNYGMKYVLTAKLNQDCVENFFSAIRAKGGLHDHPSPLEFKYRFRSYLLGRNENILCSEANIQNCEEKILDFQTLDPDVTLSQEIFNQINLIPIDDEEQIEITEYQETEQFLEDVKDLNDIEFDGLENFAGYIIFKMGLTEFGFKTSAQKDENYTYINLLSEGGLYKPNIDFLKLLEHLNTNFIKINGNSLSTSPNYMLKLLNLSNINLDIKIIKRFYLGRTFFRIRFLNRHIKETKNLYTNKKTNKIIT